MRRATPVLAVQADSFSFRNAPQAVIEDHVDLYTGEVRKRYVNKARFVGAPQTKVGHNHAPGDVPSGPPKALAERVKKVDQRIYERLKAVSICNTACA